MFLTMMNQFMQRGINDGFSRLHGGVWDIVEELNF